MNAIRFLGGEPERVLAEQLVGSSGVDVCFAAVLRLPDDVVAHFDCGFVVPYRDELEIVGDEGSLFVDDLGINSPGIEVRREPDGEIRSKLQLHPADSYQLELENISAASGDAPLLLGLATTRSDRHA